MLPRACDFDSASDPAASNDTLTPASLPCQLALLLFLPVLLLAVVWEGTGVLWRPERENALVVLKAMLEAVLPMVCWLSSMEWRAA